MQVNSISFPISALLDLYLFFVDWESRLTRVRSKQPHTLLSDKSFDPVLQRIVWLRLKLQRFPFWIRGHLELAKDSLLAKDSKTAYASLQAVLALKPQMKQGLLWNLLLGKVYLRSSNSSKAVEIFSDLYERHPTDVELTEEFAAALLSVGEQTRAQSILSAVAADVLSPESQAILGMLKSR